MSQQPLNTSQGQRRHRKQGLDRVGGAGGEEGGECSLDIDVENANDTKQLLSVEPPLPLPPNSKRRTHNGWALIDAGDFAVHILSKEAREKYWSTVDHVG